MKLLDRVLTTSALLALGIGCSALAQTASSKKKPSTTSSTKGATTSSKSSASKSASAHKTTASAKSGGKSSKKKSRSRRKPGQTAPTSDRITEIQTALAKNNAFTGEPNGKWDDSTVDAMKKFQAANGLNPSGRLDAPTLQKLGLGSQIVGVAAPLPTTTPRVSVLESEKSESVRQ